MFTRHTLPVQFIASDLVKIGMMNFNKLIDKKLIILTFGGKEKYVSEELPHTNSKKKLLTVKLLRLNVKDSASRKILTTIPMMYTVHYHYGKFKTR